MYSICAYTIWICHADIEILVGYCRLYICKTRNDNELSLWLEKRTEPLTDLNKSHALCMCLPCAHIACASNSTANFEVILVEVGILKGSYLRRFLKHDVEELLSVCFNDR